MIENKQFNKLYSILKEKSPNTIKKLEESRNKLQIQDSLNEIKIFDKSILYWSGILNNEDLMKDMLKNNSSVSPQEISQLISLLCHNKNPNLISLLIDYSNQMNSDQKNEIITEIIINTSRDCYRQENIHLISKFIEENSNEEQKNEFIKSAVEKFNKPLLSELIEINTWKKIIKNELKTSVNPFIEKIHKHYIEKLQSNQDIKEYLQDRELSKYHNIENITFTSSTPNTQKSDNTIKKISIKTPDEDKEINTEEVIDVEGSMIKVPKIVKKRKKQVSI